MDNKEALPRFTSTLTFHNKSCRHDPWFTDLRETIRTRLKDDQQDTDWHSDLFQLQVVGHPGPPQHPTHAVPGRHGKLAEANSQAVQLRCGQTQAVDQRLGETTYQRVKNKDNAGV